MENRIFVNRYKVLNVLGEGGMGKVWRVFDEVEKKEVALKEIKLKQEEKKHPAGSRISFFSTGTKDTELELRFSEEFRTMKQLQYPHTVEVYDYGVLETGNRYITMEIVEGESIHELLKNRKFEFKEIYKILIQMAQTLRFVHSRLYVHRDIKSENIMITKSGDVKLLDFGLMDRIGTNSDGKITGTVYYVPPEVINGGVVDESSDLYSLGVLGYELVAGEYPYKSEEIMDVIQMHLKSKPRPLNETRPNTPHELNSIILKLLEKEQRKRYQNSAALIKDISELMGEEITEETLDQKRSYLYCTQIIGRENEAGQLRDTFKNIKGENIKSIFIGAPAGVGKSRLIQEFKIEAQLSGVSVLEGFCVQQGMATYQPLEQAFNPILPLTKTEVLDKYGSILVKILPALESAGYKPAPVLDELAEKARLCDAIAGWLTAVSKEKPLIICIEDLHWADAASLELLNACIRSLSQYPVMFLATFRDDEVEEISPLFYTVEEKYTNILKLENLDKEAVALLVRAMLGQIDLSDDFMEQIFSGTGGNPFFVTEILRCLIEDEQIKLENGRWILPVEISDLKLLDTIETTIARRLHLLSEGALHVARIGSVIGRELDLVLLKAITAMKEEKLFEFVDELVARQFIKKEEKHYFFTHDRVRETLYEQLELDERRELHEKAGNYLESKFANEMESVVHSLAYHFQLSGDHQKAVKYLLLAAEDSLKNASYVDFTQKCKEAIMLLEKIDYPDKEKVLFEARSKFIYISWFDYAFAIDMYKKILPDIYKLAGGEKNLKAQVKIIQLIYKILNLFPKDMADKIKDKLKKDFPPYDMPKPKNYPHIIAKLVELSLWTGISCFMNNEINDVISVIGNAIECLPEREGSIEYACAMIGQAGAYTASERSALVVKDLENSIKVFEERASKLNRQQLAIYCAAWFWFNDACLWLGIQTDENVQKHYEIAEKNHVYDQIGWAYLNKMSRLSCFSGEYPKAKELQKSWSDWVKKLGRIRQMECWYNIYSSALHIFRGEFDLAKFYLEKTKKLLYSEKGQDVCWYQYYLSLFYIEQGEIEEGRKMLEQYVSFCERNDYDRLSEAYASLADIYINFGKLEDANVLLEKGIKRTTSKEYWQPPAQASLFRALGRLKLKEKEYEQAKANIEKSIEIAKKVFSPIRVGWGYVTLAELYIELTQSRQAKECLEKARAQFNEIENEYQNRKVQELEEKLNRLMS